MLFIKDAEYVQETVVINRLYHRELIAQMSRLEELEKKWNCKIIFPSTELASDVVTIAGPEWQVPQAVDEFLVSSIERLVHSVATNGILGNGP
jgi:KH domain